MPVYLKEIHDFQQLEPFRSVLIVPCRFCPAASLALRNNEPYVKFFQHLLQTAAYERYMDTLRSELGKRGVVADVFKSRLPHQFVMCMWTRRRRKQLMRRAKKYEALVVLGCEAAVQTILDTVDTVCSQVVQGMRSEGIMSILPRLQWPGNITLELNSITPLLHQEDGSQSWMRL